MSNKHFTYLVLITISLFILALFSFLIQPRYETSLKKGELVFENIKKELNDIKEINIDNNKKKISIIKDQDIWYMSTKSGYKVKNEIVRKNLIQISELRFFEKKTQDELLYSRLNLDYPNDEDSESKYISIIDNDKKVLVEFILGKKKENGVYIKKIKEISPKSFFPSPKVKSTILLIEPKTNFFEIKNPKNLEYITNIFFNQRRKMIKKPLSILFKNKDEISNKLKLNLNLRPQNLSPLVYFKLCKEYENLLN